MRATRSKCRHLKRCVLCLIAVGLLPIVLIYLLVSDQIYYRIKHQEVSCTRCCFGRQLPMSQCIWQHDESQIDQSITCYRWFSFGMSGERAFPFSLLSLFSPPRSFHSTFFFIVSHSFSSCLCFAFFDFSFSFFPLPQFSTHEKWVADVESVKETENNTTGNEIERFASMS